MFSYLLTYLTYSFSKQNSESVTAGTPLKLTSPFPLSYLVFSLPSFLPNHPSPTHPSIHTPLHSAIQSNSIQPDSPSISPLPPFL